MDRIFWNCDNNMDHINVSTGIARELWIYYFIRVITSAKIRLVELVLLSTKLDDRAAYKREHAITSSLPEDWADVPFLAVCVLASCRTKSNE